MKKVKCRITGHGRFMSKDCVDCKDVHACDSESMENKNPFDDIGVNHI